jgi:dihydroorotate dehydrogenase (fumarate)
LHVAFPSLGTLGPTATTVLLWEVTEMDLSTRYAGLELSTPVILGACPLSAARHRVGEFAEAGAGALVLPSIFEEQILESQFQPRAEPLRSVTGEILHGIEPQWDRYNGGTEGYLRILEQLKTRGTLPVLASINCTSADGWGSYLKRLEDAGADAIELHLFHYGVDPDRYSEQVEQELLDRVGYAREFVSIPLAAKLLPHFTSLANFVYRLCGAGTKSVCLFGQMPVFESDPQPEADPHWRLSNYTDFRWVLDAVHQVRLAVPTLSVAASGGVTTPQDALAALELGANAVMVTHAVYRGGAQTIRDIVTAIERQLARHHRDRLRDLIGSSLNGFDAFPDRRRREHYAARVMDLVRPEDSASAKGPQAELPDVDLPGVGETR